MTSQAALGAIEKAHTTVLKHPTDEELCNFAAYWGVCLNLAQMVTKMAQDLPFTIQVISGYRSCAQETLLGEQGRPAIACDKSNHTTVPARAMDIWPGVAVTNAVKAQVGRAATFAGLRWGGGSPADPATGIPSDWNHVDLGPRQ